MGVRQFDVTVPQHGNSYAHDVGPGCTSRWILKRYTYFREAEILRLRRRHGYFRVRCRTDMSKNSICLRPILRGALRKRVCPSSKRKSKKGQAVFTLSVWAYQVLDIEHLDYLSCSLLVPFKPSVTITKRRRAEAITQRLIAGLGCSPACLTDSAAHSSLCGSDNAFIHKVSTTESRL